MKYNNYRIGRIQVLCILLVFCSATICFSQNIEKRGQKNRNSPEGRKGNMAEKSPLPVVANGNIVLGSPTASSITASIILEPGSEVFIQYNALHKKRTKNTDHIRSENGGPVEVSLKNLEPNTIYSWCLNYRLPNEKEFRQTRMSSFSTQKKQNETFSFGVQGDSHPEREGKMFNPALYRLTLDSVAQKGVDFYFLMGDDFSLDRLLANKQVDKGKVERVYLAQRAYLGNSGRMPPLFLVNGNHEQAAKYLLDGTENNPAVVVANARDKYFPMPMPGFFYGGDKDTVAHIGHLKDYYSFEWGNALFVVIDPYWHSDIPVDNQPGSQEKKNRKDPWGITIGDQQYTWLKNTLEKSNAKFKFVFSHHVLGTGRGGVEVAKLFEWGGYNRNGTWEFPRYRPNWEMPIHELMVKNRVTIFFQGHDHLFARQELDGVIYQSVPNPADDTYTAFNRDAYQSGVILPNSGFLCVTVCATKVKVDYVRSYLKESSLLSDDAKTTFSYIIKYFSSNE